VRSGKITLAHGSGGRLSRELIEREILSRFTAGALAALPDAATLPRPGNELIFSTDSFVVSPLFFPGGNIGDLAVYGTVNDIAVCGGKPLWLSLALVLEEGLELSVLCAVLDSVKNAAQTCGVQIVTGDTKVVQRGQCDGMYLTSAGVGERLPAFALGQSRLAAGDAVLTSGPLGDHGMAVMSVREGLNFQSGPTSDTGPVHRLVAAAGELSSAVKMMRDPTRGGAAAVLNEMVSGSNFDVVLDEANIPAAPNTRALAEILGFDLLHIASEGRFLAVCERAAAEELAQRFRRFPEGAGAAIIGSVAAGQGRVVLNTVTGGRRLVSLPEGELLPRIC